MLQSSATPAAAAGDHRAVAAGALGVELVLAIGVPRGTTIGIDHGAGSAVVDYEVACGGERLQACGVTDRPDTLRSAAEGVAPKPSFVLRNRPGFSANQPRVVSYAPRSRSANAKGPERCAPEMPPTGDGFLTMNTSLLRRVTTCWPKRRGLNRRPLPRSPHSSKGPSRHRQPLFRLASHWNHFAISGSLCVGIKGRFQARFWMGKCCKPGTESRTSQNGWGEFCALGHAFDRAQIQP